MVGVAGDVVEVSNGALLCNGQRQYEPYVYVPAKYTLPPTSVPADSVFVLGDNRDVSDDSHVWGPLPIENVVGKAFYILWPIGRQGFVDELMQDLEVTADPSVFVERVGEISRDFSNSRSTSTKAGGELPETNGRTGGDK